MWCGSMKMMMCVGGCVEGLLLVLLLEVEVEVDVDVLEKKVWELCEP